MDNFESIHYRCEHCGKVFKHKQSKYRHKKICDPLHSDVEIPFNILIKELACLRQTVEEMKNELRHEFKQESLNQLSRIIDLERTINQQSPCNNIQANITNASSSNTCIGDAVTNNNNVQFVINAYGKEKTDYMTPDFMEKCIKKLAKGVLDYIKAKHFNPNHPENRNIRAENKKSFSEGYLQYYNSNDTWVDVSKQELTNEILRKNWSILDDYFSEYEKQIRPKIDNATFNKVEEWYNVMRQPGARFDRETHRSFLALCRNTLS